MIPVAVILYEDQRGPQKQFGLHNLVVACVSDDLGADVYALKLDQKLSGRPMKGVSKLLASCRQDVRRLGPQGQPVFALIDNDAIREQMKHEGLSPSADEAAVIRAIKAPERCKAPDQLEVLLLVENTETILAAAAECDPEIAAVAVEQARRKDTNARDKILNHVAWGLGRAVRDCVRSRVPALARLVERLSALVAAERDGAPRG